MTKLFREIPVIMSILMLITAACAPQPKETPKGKEYTSAYICPMHCDGSGSDAPGMCPECGMDYVENKEATEPSADTTSAQTKNQYTGRTTCWKP